MNLYDDEKIEIAILGSGKLSDLIIEKLIPTQITINILESDKNPYSGNCSVQSHSSILRVVKSSSIIITILSDGPALEEMLFGEQGILNYVSSVNTIVDMSSVSPELIKEISEQLVEKEVPFLDAAIINEVASESALIQMILIGGEEHIYKSVLPVFQTIADEVKHIGENGASQFYRQAFGVRAKR